MRNKIVVSDLEFPTVGQIWHAQARRGATVCHVAEREGLITLEALESAIDETTRFVAIGLVCYRIEARQGAKAIARIAHEKGARRFESGSPAVPNLYATLAGVGLVPSVGIANIEVCTAELTGAIQEGALGAGFRIATSCEDGSHGDLIAVQASDVSAIVEALAGDGIVTSCRDGNRRISPHFCNDLDDIERLVESMKRHRRHLA